MLPYEKHDKTVKKSGRITARGYGERVGSKPTNDYCH